MMRRARLPATIALALLGVAGAAPAQAPSLLPDLAAEKASLSGAKIAAADAEAHAAALEQAAEQAGDQATKARNRAQALGLKVKAAEADIAAAHARIALIGGLQDIARRRLAEKHGPIVKLVAALQTMARRPPALAVAQPGSVDDIVHVRLLLADAIPVIQARTVGLRADLAQQTKLRGDAEVAAQALVASRALLDKRHRELAQLEQTATLRSQRLADQAADEAQRALGLGEEARDIADRMQTLADAGDVRKRLAALPGPELRPDAGGDAVPAREGDPSYVLPAQGEITTGFGEVSGSGVSARGVTLAVAPGSAIVAPHAGRVLFVGPFRSYGQIVILSHGGGWTTTLTGLGSIKAKVGDRVRQGQAIAKAGDDKPRITTELRRDNRAIDVLALAQAG